MRVLSHKTQELELDTKDLRILKEITTNIRQPISQIAKSCLLSRQSVEYRLKQLEENKLIIGSRTVVNNTKLGYRSYHVFLEVHTPHKEKVIIARAKNANFVNAIIVFSGKYNLEISIMARNELDFLKLYQSIIKDVRIRNDNVLILLEGLRAEVLPQKCFEGLKQITNEKFSKAQKKGKKSKVKIDKQDIEILHELSKNAQVTNMQLSQKLKVSKDTIKYRITKLENEGFILQYRPVINYSVLGYSINAVLIKTNHNPDDIERFERDISSNDSIIWGTKTFGYYNYIVYIITKDLGEFHEVINQMKEHYGNIMKTYEILFAFKELKYNFMADSIVDHF